jgi:hypothetical protein
LWTGTLAVIDSGQRITPPIEIDEAELSGANCSISEYDDREEGFDAPGDTSIVTV